MEVCNLLCHVLNIWVCYLPSRRMLPDKPVQPLRQPQKVAKAFGKLAKFFALLRRGILLFTKLPHRHLLKSQDLCGKFYIALLLILCPGFAGLCALCCLLDGDLCS